MLMVAHNAHTLLNSKLLRAMKVIKIQAWEENFCTRLLGLCNMELDQLWRYFLTLGILVTMCSSVSLLIVLAMSDTYMAFGKPLDIAMAMMDLALFDIICFPMIILPQIMNSIVKVGISVKLIQEFLLSKEYIVVGEKILKENGKAYVNNRTFLYNSKKPHFVHDCKGGKEGVGKGNNEGE